MPTERMKKLLHTLPTRPSTSLGLEFLCGQWNQSRIRLSISTTIFRAGGRTPSTRMPSWTGERSIGMQMSELQLQNTVKRMRAYLSDQHFTHKCLFMLTPTSILLQHPILSCVLSCISWGCDNASRAALQGRRYEQSAPFCRRFDRILSLHETGSLRQAYICDLHDPSSCFDAHHCREAV